LQGKCGITEAPQFTDLPIYKYKAKSKGPDEAEAWIKRDAKEWWTK